MKYCDLLLLHCRSLSLSGKNVVIKGSYLWDNVTIEDNCVIDTSIVCTGVTVYEGVKLCPGCILASKVSVFS